MKQPTKEQAIRYFQRMGMKDRGDISKFMYELGEIELMLDFINSSDEIAPRISTLDPPQRLELAQLLRKVARIIELSDVAFPR